MLSIPFFIFESIIWCLILISFLQDLMDFQRILDCIMMACTMLVSKREALYAMQGVAICSIMYNHE